MRRMHGGLVAALENEKVTNPQEDGELPDHADSLETDVADVNEASNEGESDQRDLDETEATGAALESFVVALEGFQQNGGLESQGAHILALATEHFLGNVGSSGAKVAIPAMESFGGTGGRVQAGRIALENLKDEIKKIWDAIVAQIKKAVQWLKDYWNKVFGAAEKLKRRAVELEERARQTTGSFGSKTEIDDGSLANKVMVQGSATNIQGLTEIKTVLSAIVSRGAALSGDLGTKAVEAVKEVTKKNLPAILKACEPIPGSHKVANPQEVGVAAAPEGLAVYATGQLPGNYVVISWVPEGSKADVTSQIKALQGVAYKTVQINKGQSATSKKLPTLKQGDMGAIAKTVGDIADELLSYRKNGDALSGKANELASAAEGVANKAGEEENEEKRSDLQAVKAVATMANRAFVEPGASFSKYTITTCEAYLHWIEKSIKNYGAEK